MNVKKILYIILASIIIMSIICYFVNLESFANTDIPVQINTSVVRANELAQFSAKLKQLSDTAQKEAVRIVEDAQKETVIKEAARQEAARQSLIQQTASLPQKTQTLVTEEPPPPPPPPPQVKTVDLSMYKK